MQSFHLQILNAMAQLEFNIGKTTLVSFVLGDLNPTIEKNRLDEHDCYGCLHKLKRPHIFAIISELEKDELIGNKYTSSGLKTLRITPKGRDELITPSKDYSKAGQEKITIKQVNSNLKETDLSHLEQVLPQFSFFTSNLNKKQQLAVLDPHESILCVAGAGSGKTTVLIKRIEFLVKFKGVKEEEILAVTFTTKARDEMRTRLEKIGLKNISIHTFNSFCEQQLRAIQQENSELVHSSRVLNFSDKIQIVRSIIQEQKLQFEFIAREYFSSRQRKEKSSDELFLTFCYEIFSIIDYSKNTNQTIEEYANTAPQSIKHVAKHIEIILKEIPNKMKLMQTRDFTDQILEVNALYKKFPAYIPQFSHILVDEYQDINKIQLDLIQLLHAPNNFCVGDPRQSIYNWRGSDIAFILDFEKYFPTSHIVMLEYNYRSKKEIVTLANQIIKPLNLPNLIVPKFNEMESQSIQVVECKTVEDEHLIALATIKTALKNETQPNEIFVLSRTNRSLEDFSKILLTHGIQFHIKSDEFSTKRQEPLRKDQIILATIHAIKGQEAQKVIILDASSQYFPNKVQDNEFIAHVKSIASYDKYQEELRLFYVACTRAKQELIILYSGFITSFMPKEYVNSVNVSSQKKLQSFLFNSTEKKESKTSSNFTQRNNSSILMDLKKLRLKLANMLGIQTHELMTNTQLQQIISRKPHSVEELEEILYPNGYVAKKYGNKILEILN